MSHEQVMEDGMSTLIRVEELRKTYYMGDSQIHALDGIDLEIDQGEIVCLLGPSGSGKSTLLNALAGLERPDSGSIYYQDIRFDQLKEAEITRFRSLNVGFVFQSYNLINTLTALENVTLGLTFKGFRANERDQIAKDMLTRVGLGDRLRHKPNQLSGGQQQRVSIARAFAGDPKIIFADEPTGNLDTHTSYEVLDLISSMVRDKGQTFIMVTHDEEMTCYADRVLHMRDGRIERAYSIKTDTHRGPLTEESPPGATHGRDPTGVAVGKRSHRSS